MCSTPRTHAEHGLGLRGAGGKVRIRHPHPEDGTDNEWGHAVAVWYDSEAVGHKFSIALDDGMILTTYGNYKIGSALILWKP